MCKFCDGSEYIPMQKGMESTVVQLTQSGRYIRVMQPNGDSVLTDTINYCPMCGKNFRSGYMPKKGGAKRDKPKDGRYKVYRGSAQDYVYVRAILKQDGKWTVEHEEMDKDVRFERGVNDKDFAKCHWKHYNMLKDVCNLAKEFHDKHRLVDKDELVVAFEDGRDEPQGQAEGEQAREQGGSAKEKLAAYLK